MPVTVYRTRNGVREPIKLHFLDALLGAPPVRKPASRTPSSHTPSSRSAASMNWFHELGSATVPSVSNKSKFNNSANNKAASTNNANGNHSAAQPEIWTPEDDKKLLELKAENMPWKEIIKVLGKSSVTGAKQHFKTIEGRVDVASAGGNGNGGADANAWKNESNNVGAKVAKAYAEHANASVEKANTKKKTKHPKPPGSYPRSASSSSSATAVAGSPISTNNNRAGSKGGDESLKRWATLYDENKWRTLASKHFDRTGERISEKTAEALYG